MRVDRESLLSSLEAVVPGLSNKETVEQADCFTADTIINTLGGDFSVSELLAMGRTAFKVFSMEGETLRIGDAFGLRKVNTADVYRVVFDSGDELKLTADHLVMLRNGGYRKVCDLEVGDSIMPFNHYRRHDGYRIIYRKVSSKPVRAYRWVYEEIHNKVVRKPMHIHHRDYNPRNDEPDNLIEVSMSDHAKSHFQGRSNPSCRPAVARKIRFSLMGNKNGIGKKPGTSKAMIGNMNACKPPHPDPKVEASRKASREYQRRKRATLGNNHKVVSVEYVGREDVYDLSVHRYHNFAANGVFIHNCFVFMDGVVRTFNEEIGCTMPVKLPGITGAVKARPMMDVLRQMQDDELAVIVDDNGSLCLKGKKGRVVKMRMQAEILLPLANIEIPEVWQEVSPEYCDALLMVHECATEKDEDRFYSTCVHIGKGRIEATDNISQLMRYRVKTRISRSSCLKKKSAMHVAEMGAREFAETERFLHYRNDGGLVMSVVRYIEDYPDLSSTCEVSGERVVLPKSMGEAAGIAEVFSREQKENNFLVLSLSRDRIMMEGIGESGEYRHPVECIYDGPSMSFMIPPKLLKAVIDKYQEALIAPERLFVQGERFVYVSRLRDPSVFKQSKKKKEDA